MRGHPLYLGVSGRAVEVAAANLDLVEAGAGTVLRREGRGNPAFWIVLEGRLEVSVGGRPRRVVGPGGFVGGFSLLTARPAAATVRTLTRVRALAAGADQFRAVASDDLVRLRLRAAYGDRYRDDLADALTAAS